MKERIGIHKVRNALRIADDVVPILNETEYMMLMVFFSQVIERYEKEEYPSEYKKEGNK